MSKRSRYSAEKKGANTARASGEPGSCMNVWLFQTGEPLPIKKNVRKMRTALLADKLLEKGHSVLWWASAFDHHNKCWIFNKDIELNLNDRYKIKILKGISYKKNVSFSRYLNYKLIALKAKKLIKQEKKPDIIIASTPSYDLAYIAVRFANNNKIPVLVDIRDEWPESFIKHTKLSKSPFFIQYLMKIILFYDFLILKNALRFSDGLISMMSTYIDWGLKYTNREMNWKDMVFYIGCENSHKSNNNSEKVIKLKKNFENKFVVCFIGTFGVTNDPSIILESAKKLVDYNCSFILAGDGELFEEISKKSSHLPNVILTGWLDKDEINTLLSYSQIGVCPTPKKRDALPNKFFLYLSHGIPIISAWQGDAKKLIDEHKIGFYYPPNDTDTFVKYLLSAMNDKLLYDKLTKNVLKFYETYGDSEKIYSRYVEHIDLVAADFYANKEL